MSKIIKAMANFEKAPLTHPFGFKGGAVNDLWQTCCYIETDDGHSADGLGCQNTLWSDKDVFLSVSPASSSAIMYLITEFACKKLVGMEFINPEKAIDAILNDCIEYANKVANMKVRTTWVLNALVAVDHALWKLYAQINGNNKMDEIMPEYAKPFMKNRYDRISVIPLISYGVTLDEIKQLVNDGFFFLKIKIGSDPDKDGNLDKMLAWDKNRIKQVHDAVKDIKTPYTESGHIAYYLDANGRYDSIDRLKELLDYAQEIGVLERTIIVEEPFPENYKVDVSSLNARIAADESAHSPDDVIERISLGYSAIALKPIAKTMSVTYKMIAEAGKRGIPCFCADLTVGPLMVEVNKSFASRLSLLPGLKLPVVESNGWQNYREWELLKTYNPTNNKPYTVFEHGGYDLNDEFYDTSAGMYERYDHYYDLAKYE